MESSASEPESPNDSEGDNDDEGDAGDHGPRYHVDVPTAAPGHDAGGGPGCRAPGEKSHPVP